MDALSKNQIVEGLKKVGVLHGDTLLVHSALKPIGMVEGGSATVAQALHECVGSTGTLTAPAFTFKHETVPCPVIDPLNDKSEMGAISESIRTLSGAKRSAAYRHSISAMGKNADFLTGGDPYYSVFDRDNGSFGKLLSLDAKILLIGVIYTSSTSHHFAEYLAGVPERHTIVRNVLLKMSNGSTRQQQMTDYQPKPTTDGRYYSHPHDFNRSGKLLEDRGLVSIGTIGNAYIRLFRMKDLIDLLISEYRKDHTIFWENEATGPAVLPDGITVSPGILLDGANREW